MSLLLIHLLVHCMHVLFYVFHTVAPYGPLEHLHTVTCA